MPLIESPTDKARQKNIETEIHAHKPIKQAVAIGYSEQREAKAKEHKNSNSGADMPMHINIESHQLLKKTAPMVDKSRLW